MVERGDAVVIEVLDTAACGEGGFGGRLAGAEEVEARSGAAGEKSGDQARYSKRGYFDEAASCGLRLWTANGARKRS